MSGRSRTCYSTSALGSGCPVWWTTKARRNTPVATPTTSSTTTASRASACWPAGAARTAARRAAARRTRTSWSAMSRTSASGARKWRPISATSNTPTRTIWTTRSRWASSPRPSRSSCNSTPRSCRSSAWRPRGTARCNHRSAIAPGWRGISTRCRSGTRRSRRRRPRTATHCTRSPSGRWRCIIPGARKTPGCARSMATTGYMCRGWRRRCRAWSTTTGSG